MASYVCWDCRWRPAFEEQNYSRDPKCRKCGKEMEWCHLYVPASRDDHKMWKLAERKHKQPTGRPRRRRMRYSLRARVKGMADWEKELLKSAKK
ncbi:hypothetical protein MINTM005_13930 [Mycobacterium intracellulare]|uniref:hypothetical protein n=1 Tax=Mycobacterium intracellulare TaxID=1767 RepID=UPI00079FF1B0|nr:hypothetical protein [Mycobacterium intracellulare]BCO56149.1 hypothetical protein MINTM005_13930 [Mycobacterium intracellulare]